MYGHDTVRCRPRSKLHGSGAHLRERPVGCVGRRLSVFWLLLLTHPHASTLERCEGCLRAALRMYGSFSYQETGGAPHVLRSLCHLERVLRYRACGGSFDQRGQAHASPLELKLHIGRSMCASRAIASVTFEISSSCRATAQQASSRHRCRCTKRSLSANAPSAGGGRTCS